MIKKDVTKMNRGGSKKNYALSIMTIFLMLFSVILLSQASLAESLTRSSSVGEVEVDISIIDPGAVYSGNEFIFSAALNSHSVSLDEYMIEELFYLRNQRGLVFKAIAWESPKGGGHHRFGNLSFPGKESDGKAIILNDDKYIEVLVKGLGGIKESVFRWELPLNGESVSSETSYSKAYIAMAFSDSVKVIDTDRLEVTDTLQGGKNPHGVTASPDGKFLYLPSMFGGTEYLTVVDTAKREVTDSIKIGKASHHAAVSPDGRELYVAVFPEDEGVVVIDTRTRKIVDRIYTGKKPFYLEFSPDGSRVYVMNVESGELAVIDAASRSVVASIEIGPGRGHLSISRDGKQVFLTNDELQSLIAVDVVKEEVLWRTKTGASPHGVAITHDGKLVYVANRGGKTLSVVDTSTRKVTGEIEVGNAPDHLTITPDGRYLYISMLGSEEVVVYDVAGKKQVAIIPVGPQPHQIIFGP